MCLPVEFLDNRHAGLDLVAFDFLAYEETDAVAVVVAQQLFELVRLVVLASESNDKHAARIGM